MNNKFLTTCTEILRYSNQLDPNEFTTYIIAHNNLGLFNEVISIIQHNVYLNMQDYNRIKYIYCIDKLIRTSQYNHIINQIISSIYSHILISYFKNNHEMKVEQLKIIWNLWLFHRYLNVNNIFYTKNFILNTVHIDITKMMPKSVKFLQQYYSRNSQNKPIKIYHKIATTTATTNIVINGRQSSEEKKTDIQDELIIPKKKIKIQSETTKYYSLKEQKYLQQKQYEQIKKSKSILDKLKVINPYECKRCGKYYLSLQNYNLHIQMHIKSKQLELMKNKTKKNFLKNKILLTNIKEWIKCAKEIDLKNNAIYITYQNAKQYYQKQRIIQKNIISKINCYFCKKSLLLTMNNNQWVYINTLKISNGELIHLDCLKAINVEHYESESYHQQL